MSCTEDSFAFGTQFCVSPFQFRIYSKSEWPLSGVDATIQRASQGHGERTSAVEIRETHRKASSQDGKTSIMTTVTIEEAQARLPELIEHLAAGEQIVITRNQEPIARLLAEQKSPRRPRKAGSAKGQLVIVAEDDEHLKDFAEYME